MEEQIQNQVSLLIGKYGWLFLVGVITLLFRSTIEKGVAGFMVFVGNDYNEDDVVEVDGSPARIVRVGMKSTTFHFPDTNTKKTVSNATFTTLDIERKMKDWNDNPQK